MSDKIEALVRVLEKLPPEKAEAIRGLLMQEGSDALKGPNLAKVLGALKLRRDDLAGIIPPSIMRAVCTVLEPFLVQSRDGGEEGTILRASLMPWWEAVTQRFSYLSDYEEAYAQAFSGIGRSPQEILLEARRQLVIVSRSLATTLDDKAMRGEIGRIAQILNGGDALREALTRLDVTGPAPRDRQPLSEAAIANLPDLYAEIAQNRAFETSLLGLALLNRVDRPGQVLSCVAGIAKLRDKPEAAAAAARDVATLGRRSVGDLAGIGRVAANAIQSALQSGEPPAFDLALAMVTRYYASVAEIKELTKTKAGVKNDAAAPIATIEARFTGVVAPMMADLESLVIAESRAPDRLYHTIMGLFGQFSTNAKRESYGARALALLRDIAPASAPTA